MHLCASHINEKEKRYKRERKSSVMPNLFFIIKAKNFDKSILYIPNSWEIHKIHSKKNACILTFGNNVKYMLYSDFIVMINVCMFVFIINIFTFKINNYGELSTVNIILL